MKKIYRIGFYCGGFADARMNYWNFLACAGTRGAAERIAAELENEYGEKPEIITEVVEK